MKIMCDSTCDLPLTFIEENDLHLFSVLITLGEEEFRDILDIDTNTIYSYIKKGIHPKTAQVAVAAFYKQFKKLATAKEEGIYICVSSQLSGTYNTALMALEAVKAEYPDVNIKIIDSKTASIGVGVMLTEAIEMKNAGKSLEELAEVWLIVKIPKRAKISWQKLKNTLMPVASYSNQLGLVSHHMQDQERLELRF